MSYYQYNNAFSNDNFETIDKLARNFNNERKICQQNKKLIDNNYNLNNIQNQQNKSLQYRNVNKNRNMNKHMNNFDNAQCVINASDISYAPLMSNTAMNMVYGYAPYNSTCSAYGDFRSGVPTHNDTYNDSFKYMDNINAPYLSYNDSLLDNETTNSNFPFRTLYNEVSELIDNDVDNDIDNNIDNNDTFSNMSNNTHASSFKSSFPSTGFTYKKPEQSFHPNNNSNNNINTNTNEIKKSDILNELNYNINEHMTNESDKSDNSIEKEKTNNININKQEIITILILLLMGIFIIIIMDMVF